MSAIPGQPADLLGLEARLIDAGVELRAGTVRGTAASDHRGVRLRLDPFFAAETAAAGQVVEVEWRHGAEQFTALAPVVARGGGALVLGAFRWARSLGPVRRLDWNLFVAASRNGRPWDGVYRVGRAESDRLHLAIPARVPVRADDLWQGWLRAPNGLALHVRLQVRGAPELWTASGHRIVMARWQPV